jgi:hypothetical protein
LALVTRYLDASARSAAAAQAAAATLAGTERQRQEHHAAALAAEQLARTEADRRAANEAAHQKEVGPGLLFCILSTASSFASSCIPFGLPGSSSVKRLSPSPLIGGCVALQLTS